MKITYIEKKFNKKSLILISLINNVINEYQAQGYDLTIRQLYYQLVARGYIENNQRSYKRLVSLVSDARLAGEISWEAIVDRTRNLDTPSAWDNPQDILKSAYRSYAIDLWDNQDYRVEVWVEKDALRGVINSVCRRLNVPDFACRGYTSQSEMWAAGKRLLNHYDNGQKPVIVHLGDHDPSGIDMSRDIVDRLELFMGLPEGEGFEFIRAALNMDQIREYDPPPFFAKLTDSRINGYIEQYGTDSWELDALDPSTLDQIITNIVDRYRDDDKFERQKEKQEAQRSQLKFIHDKFHEIAKKGKT